METLKASLVVSIRAPRAGRKIRRSESPVVTRRVSIRAPRAGRKVCVRRPVSKPRSFNPRPACGAKAWHSHGNVAKLDVSIRAPRAGRKCLGVVLPQCVDCFNPRPACGAKVGIARQNHRQTCFNPRPACGAKAGVCVNLLPAVVFKSAPRVRGESPASEDVGLNELSDWLPRMPVFEADSQDAREFIMIGNLDS